MRIAIHLPQLERGGKFHEEVYGILLRLFHEFDGVFVLQSSYDYPELQKRLQQLGKAWNASRIWFFGNMPDWMNALSEVDFVIGCRIHGTMAVIAAGKAALILPTDFRTLEMAQAMKLPMIFGSELDRLNPKPSRGRTCMGPERAWLEQICGQPSVFAKKDTTVPIWIGIPDLKTKSFRNVFRKMLVQSVATDCFCQQKPQRNSGILGSKTSQAEASSVDEMATRKRRQLIIVSWLCWVVGEVCSWVWWNGTPQVSQFRTFFEVLEF